MGPTFNKFIEKGPPSSGTTCHPGQQILEGPLLIPNIQLVRSLNFPLFHPNYLSPLHRLPFQSILYTKPMVPSAHTNLGARRHGSAVKNAYHSCWGPRFSSPKHTWGLRTICMGSNPLFCLHKCQAHTWCIYIRAGKHSYIYI